MGDEGIGRIVGDLAVRGDVLTIGPHGLTAGEDYTESTASTEVFSAAGTPTCV